MDVEFPHKQLSHCENGTICNLLSFHNFQISEPLVFGIGSGIFFAHMPFVKNQGIPLTSYRIFPGQIYNNATKRLGIKMCKRTYKNQHDAMSEMDALIEKGQPVGILTNLYYLPFFPKSYRFHYNAHNTIIYGRHGDTYLVSDPVLQHKTEIKYKDLLKARFANGVLTIKGDLYYPTAIPEEVDLNRAIVKGIKATSKLMVNNLIPYHGVNGIKILAKKLTKLSKKNEPEFLNLFMGNIIRMQEEAGTGGAGFRYMYAAFLQEASRILKKDWIFEESVEMTKIGDRWRDFAVIAGRILKGRNSPEENISIINETLFEIAEREKKLFKTLASVNLP